MYIGFKPRVKEKAVTDEQGGCAEVDKISADTARRVVTPPYIELRV